MRDEKKLLLNEIKEKIDGSSAMIVTRYEKLPPNGSWTLRENLEKAGSHFEIVRKRMFLKAAEAAGIHFDEEMLKGHIGIAFVQAAPQADVQPDPMTCAKVLFKFSEENAQTIEVLFGRIDGKILPGKEVEYLSKLPSLNEMRAQLLALLVSPMSQTLAVFDAAIEKNSKTE